MSKRFIVEAPSALLDRLAMSFDAQEWAEQKAKDAHLRAMGWIPPLPQRLGRVEGLTLLIWAKEHPPPHFHVEYQGEDASFSILTCERLAGVKGLERFERTIRKWWESNQTGLIAAWNSSRPSDCPVGPVISP